MFSELFVLLFLVHLASNTQIVVILFVWYCGPTCKGCKKPYCIKEYGDSGRGRADEISPYCKGCERPPCSLCGNAYACVRAFPVASGKQYFCESKACVRKRRKENNWWTSDACIPFQMKIFSRSAGTSWRKSVYDYNSCCDIHVDRTLPMNGVEKLRISGFRLECLRERRTSLWRFIFFFCLWRQSYFSRDKNIIT